MSQFGDVFLSNYQVTTTTRMYTVGAVHHISTLISLHGKQVFLK